MEGNFVDDPPDDIVCPVCLLPCKDPHLISCCGRKLCLSCITGIQESEVEQTCPCCRSNNYNIMIDRLVERHVLDLKVFCKHKDEGCTWIGELRDFENHTKTCLHQVVSCVYNCGFHSTQIDMYLHERDTCDFRPEVFLKNEIETLKERVSVLEKKCKIKDEETESQRQHINQYKCTIEDNEVHTQIILKANDEVNNKLITVSEAKEELKSYNEHLEAKLLENKNKFKLLCNEMMSLLRNADLSDTENEEILTEGDDDTPSMLYASMSVKKDNKKGKRTVDDSSSKTPSLFELYDDTCINKKEPMESSEENIKIAVDDEEDESDIKSEKY